MLFERLPKAWIGAEKRGGLPLAGPAFTGEGFYVASREGSDPAPVPAEGAVEARDDGFDRGFASGERPGERPSKRLRQDRIGPRVRQRKAPTSRAWREQLRVGARLSSRDEFSR
jgi:hypothetical protein